MDDLAPFTSPRHGSSEGALEVLGGLVLEDGRRWGDAAADFQHDDAVAILSDTGPRLHYLTRPRGSSKTTDLGGAGIAMLLDQIPAGARMYAVASDRDQGRLLVDAIAGFVLRTPGLAGALRVDRFTVTATRGGASLEVLAADGPSAYGLLPHAVIVDELAQWKSTPEPRQVWEAIVSALPKVPGCRLVVLTSAGDPAHWSHRVLESAKVSPAWRVHEVAGPTPWIATEALDEQRRLLLPSQYARLHLNEWMAAEDRLTTLDDVRACVHLETPPIVAGERYVVGVDLGLKHDRAVAAVCHLEREADTTTVVLDRMQVWTPTRDRPVDLTEVEAWLLEAHGAYGKVELVLDVWQAAAMAQRLRAKHVRVREFTFSQSSVGQLAQVLYRLLRDHQLDLPDDEELIDELANVRLREPSPGVVRMDHDADRHDDRAIALALAAKHLLDRPLVGRRLHYRGTEVESWNPLPKVSANAPPGERARAARDAAYAELMRPKPMSPIGGYP